MVSVIAALICSANVASLALLVAADRRETRAVSDPLVVESLANAQRLVFTVRPAVRPAA